jgi:hypothetical protein
MNCKFCYTQLNQNISKVFQICDTCNCKYYFDKDDTIRTIIISYDKYKAFIFYNKNATELYINSKLVHKLDYAMDATPDTVVNKIKTIVSFS